MAHFNYFCMLSQLEMSCVHSGAQQVNKALLATQSNAYDKTQTAHIAAIRAALLRTRTTASAASEAQGA
eukprot:5961-Heterococcus_DN1.PRE.2